MKNLSTDHETARKQVWLREKERILDNLLKSSDFDTDTDLDKVANVLADQWLADFDRKFPRDDYLTTTPHREFVKCPQCGVVDVSIGSGLCSDCTTRNDYNEGQHDNSPK